jgi:hypothetical protein
MAWSSSIQWKVENTTNLQLVSGIFLLFETILGQMSKYANPNTSHQSWLQKETLLNLPTLEV